ncbi:TELO2-interacting protein 1 homolog [Acanthaster planci]|uniref:TELO2-interacting protein 1 homolog n=1 Tax=Acanthaster planci TaxID=133434 RepID=A0A8B7ZH21_ACAPL|nr:TELO2-interacting protein 1 homolog [Acanthaster planci]
MTQSAFERLRPLCVRLSKEPSNSTVEQLRTLLEGMDEGTLEPLQQYLLFPLRLVLREPKKMPAGCCENALGCISKIFSCTMVRDWPVFSDFFSTLCILVSPEANVGGASSPAEELKMAVVSCLEDLLKSASDFVLSRLYSPQFLPAAGHAVSVLLGMAESEKLKELRVKAMMCLQHLAQCGGGELASNTIKESRACFASFLPGISLALSRVILGDTKQGQKVTVAAIHTWSKIVAMVMDDLYTPNQSNEDNKCPLLEEGEAKCPGRDLWVERTSKWVDSTAKKLDILIGRIVAMATNPNWKIRLAMVIFSEKLLFSCKSSLSASIPKFLELLVSLVGDEYDQVAARCKAVLERFAQAHMGGEDEGDGVGKPLVELLEENLHSLMTALPRLMRTADDATKLARLNLVIGYLKLLGPRISSLLHSVAHLRRLSLALLQVLELDLRDIKILEEATLRPESAVSAVDTFQPYPARRKHFKQFADERIHKAIIEICHLLGMHGNITLLVDHFLGLFHESSSHRKQAVLVLNEIMLGTRVTPLDDSNKTSWEGSASPALRDTTEIESAVRTLLQEYLSPMHWNLPTCPSQSEAISAPKDTSNWLVVSQQERGNVSLAMLNSNVLLISLLLEGIGAFAQVLGPAFSLLLMDCLYPVLEKLADEKAVISQTAYSTVVQICIACGYQTIPALLSSNADYLVDAISSSLRHLEMNPKAPLVLQVTLRHSNAEMLPLLQDTIDEILLTLDQYHKEVAATVMDVLKTLVMAIYRWYPCDDKKTEPSEEDSQPLLDKDPAGQDRELADDLPITLQSIGDFFLEHLRLKRIAEGDVREEDIDDDPGMHPSQASGEEMDGGDEVDKEKALPMHIKTVKEVLERCLHFLSSSDPRLRLKVLETVKHGILALRNHQDELLPLIHRLWPAFVQRFQDTEQLVTCRACETLHTMADTAGDFIQKRVIKDVWPKLVSILEAQAKISEKAGPAYLHTSACKLQLAVLHCAGPICSKAGVGGGELAKMATACLPYLSARQPGVLQAAAKESFGAFADLEPDAVWVTLNDVHCPSSRRAPHECFPAHKFFGEINPHRGEYAKNILRLLDQLQPRPILQETLKRQGHRLPSEEGTG